MTKRAPKLPVRNPALDLHECHKCHRELAPAEQKDQKRWAYKTCNACLNLLTQAS